MAEQESSSPETLRLLKQLQDTVEAITKSVAVEDLHAGGRPSPSARGGCFGTFGTWGGCFGSFGCYGCESIAAPGTGTGTPK